MCSRCKAAPAKWGYCLPCYRAWKEAWRELPSPQARPCAMCGEVIDWSRNRHAVYCSPRCRSRASHRRTRARAAVEALQAASDAQAGASAPAAVAQAVGATA